MARLLAVALALAVLAGVSWADEKKPGPEPGPKVGQRWEYAELHFSAATIRAMRLPPGANPLPGGRVAPGRATPVRWVTAEGETEADSWEALATKLKAPAAARGATPLAHKVKLLNHLGAQGWELVSGSNTAMIFKRKSPR